MQSVAAKFVFVLITAATGMITARALHPDGRGELAALGVWPNFLGNAMTFGLPSAIIYWSRRDPKENSSLVWAAVPLTVLLATCAALLGIWGIPFWLAQYSPHVIHVAQVLMLNVFVVLWVSVAQAVVQANSDFAASNVALCLTPLCSFLLLIAVQATRGLTPASASIAYVLGGLPACFYLTYHLRQPWNGCVTRIWLASRRLLQYGVRSYGVDLCGTLSLYVDQAIVIRLLVPGAMGTYVVALSLSRMLNVVHQAVATVLFPKVIGLNSSELIHLTGKATRVSTLTTAAFGLLVAALGPLALPILYGREYEAATGILNVLILEVIITGATLVLTRAFMALGRPGLVTMLQASGLIVSIPFLLFMVPRWGAYGASLALLTASLIRLVFTAWSFPLVLREKCPDFILNRSEMMELINKSKIIYLNNLRKYKFGRQKVYSRNAVICIAGSQVTPAIRDGSDEQ